MRRPTPHQLDVLRYIADHPRNQLMICGGMHACIAWNGGPKSAPRCTWPTATTLRDRQLVEADPAGPRVHWATYYRISELGLQVLAAREAFQ